MSYWANHSDYSSCWPSHHFSGTREIDGKVYSVFLNNINQPVAYLREEGRKIFRHCDEQIKESQHLSASEAQIEYLIYDFDAKVGDKIAVYGITYDAKLFDSCEIEILCCDTIEMHTSDGKKIKRLRHRASWTGWPDLEVTVIEGMGFDRGFLYSPQWAVSLAATINELLTYSPDKIRWCSDNEYGDFFLKDFYKEAVNAGVSTTESDNNPDSPVYDLMGREIKEPAPGTVYIQGGRKLIAR